MQAAARAASKGLTGVGRLRALVLCYSSVLEYQVSWASLTLAATGRAQRALDVQTPGEAWAYEGQYV